MDLIDLIEKQTTRILEHFCIQKSGVAFDLIAKKTANEIGIDLNNYKKLLLKKPHKIEKETEIKLSLFNFKMNILTDNCSFISKIETILYFVTNYGEFTLNNSKYEGLIKIDNNDYKLSVSLEENKISYKISYLNNEFSGQYVLTNLNKSYIKYETKSVEAIDNSTSYNVSINRVVDMYDEEGIKYFSYDETENLVKNENKVIYFDIINNNQTSNQKMKRLINKEAI